MRARASGEATGIGGTGAGGAGTSAQTWEWDGTAWTPDMVGGPAARYAAQGTAVMYGGAGFNIRYGDTWVLRVKCYPNCDASTTPPVLNVSDFFCFLNRFANAPLYANCDASTAPPVLNVQDFSCFLNRFTSGCL